MKPTNRNSLALAVTGIAALALEVAAGFAVAPHVLEAMDRGQARTLITAGTTAARGVAFGVTSRAVELAGDLVIHGLRGTAQTYDAILRLTPERAERRVRLIRTASIQEMPAESRAAQASREAVVEVGEPDDVSFQPAQPSAAPTKRETCTHAGDPDVIIVRGIPVGPIVNEKGLLVLPDRPEATFIGPVMPNECVERTMPAPPEAPSAAKDVTSRLWNYGRTIS